MTETIEKPVQKTSPAEAKPGGIFSHAGFVKLFIGSLFGTLGDRFHQMALIAAANVIFVASASEKQIVKIQIVATVPGLLLYGLSGSMVDTFDRRRLMMVIKALKFVSVLLLAPLLWQVVKLSGATADPSFLWNGCLAVIVLLNIFSVPFSPARAAAVPDVAPLEHRSLGASLMATTGLISLLVGSAAGAWLARGDKLGPAGTVALASGFYLVASLLFSRLPAAVAVPGNRRESDAQTAAAPPAKMGLSEYLRGIWEGVAYAFKHPSTLGLIMFETVFWTVASAFYVLLLFHARTDLQLEGDDRTTFFGICLGFAGVGLFGGAFGVGKICSKVSPIVTYTPAFLLIGLGLYGFFESHLVDGHVPYWVYGVLFCLGLGGGLTLGRVDADVLAVTDARIRGRIFSLKSMAFAATILATMLLITEAGLSDEQTAKLARWMPRILFMLLPVAFIFSWIIDVAMFAEKGDSELPGPLHRFGYAALRWTSKMMFKVFFRYEVIGAENIPASGPVIVAANHASFLDPLFLGCGMKRIVQYIMYSSYYRSLAHPIFRFLRTVPVDEKGPLAALKAGKRSLDKGAVVGIFPEGRVAPDGILQEPQGGFVFLAQRSGAPIVPVAIKGNYDAFPRRAWLPRFKKVTIIVGKPIPVSKNLSKHETAEMVDRLMGEIAAMLGVPPPPRTADKLKE
jgi:1-acyl-sn-glycerol-3-phosphate acyltransferase